MASDCPFCSIIHDGDHVDLVYEDQFTLAFLPLRFAVPGHTLVIPKRHFPFINDMTPMEWRDVGNTIQLVWNKLWAYHKPHGINLVQSNGASATQTVYHVHFHLLPRWKGDPWGHFWPKSETLLPDNRKELARRLREEF